MTAEERADQEAADRLAQERIESAMRAAEAAERAHELVVKAGGGQ